MGGAGDGGTPSPPVSEGARARAARYLSSPALKAALGSYIATRAIVLLAAWVGVGQAIAEKPTVHYRGPFTEAALMWDAAWYVSVAKGGYTLPPAPELSNLAFPPLLSMLVRVLGNLFDWSGLSVGFPGIGNWALAGLVVTNAAFLASLYLLWHLVAMDHPQAVASRTLWLAAAFPLGLFWSAIYTESLFLLLAVGCVLAARNRLWPLAGALGGLAAVTRWAGIALAGVLLVEWWAANRPLRAGRPLSAWLSLGWIGLVPLALAAHLLYVWAEFGSPFVVSQVMEERWQHRASFFIGTYTRSVSLLWQSLTQSGPDRAIVLELGEGNPLYMWLDLGIPLLFALLGLIGWRRGWLRPGDLAWLALGILFPLSADNTRSLARYMMPLWPALIVAARLCEGRPMFKVAWLAISTALLATCAFIYANGKWIG